MEDYCQFSFHLIRVSKSEGGRSFTNLSIVAVLIQQQLHLQQSFSINNLLVVSSVTFFQMRVRGSDKNKKIAIVEDDPDIRSLLSITLTQKFNLPEPFVFNDGTSLVKALMEERLTFDVIIMDYRMPEMNGIEAAKIVNRQRAGTKIILATGYDKKDEAASAGLLYLQKPFSIEALARMLEER